MGRIIIIIIIAFLVILKSNAFGIDLPPGVPDTGLWGTTHPIDSPVPSTATACPNWPSTVSTNCYFVDNTDAGCSDSRTNGTPDDPRCSINEAVTYAAGSYLSINNYNYSGGGQIILTMNGTAESPIWVVGTNMSLVGQAIIKGSYIIFDNIDFATNSGTLQLRPHNGSTVNHFAIRNSKFTGSGTLSGASGSAVAIYGDSTNSVNNIILYNNEISDYGDDDDMSTQADVHGVQPTSYSNNVWIIGNTIHNNQGDAVQVGSVGLSETARPHYVYVGDNTMYEDRENAIDIKSADHVVITSNVIYGYSESASSNGEAIVTHDNSVNVWYINNNISSAAEGLVVSAATETYVIGNIIHDVEKGINIWNAVAVPLINNTVADYSVVGIAITPSSTPIINNLFYNSIQSTEIDLSFGSAAAVSTSTTDGLLFSPESAKINISGSPISIANLVSTYSQCGTFCQDSSTGNFFNTLVDDYRLVSGSNAIDNGIESSIYSTFFGIYGVSIAEDAAGIVRPHGHWDIGAYEYNPNAPQFNLNGTGQIPLSGSGTMTLQ